ncbi:MAG: FKBP-type peptidyl-prolyl cis-trans isomerase [Candidatus Aquicultor sp.]
MVIKDGSEVTFSYRLFSGEELMDETLPDKPMIYVQGEGHLIPGLEQAMLGLKEGDTADITVEPDEAYGMPQEDKIVRVPKENIPKEANVHLHAQVPAKSPDGEMVVGIVIEENDELVVIDFNHELAGRQLRFEIEILKVSGD